jgi:hypothetical protein
VRLLCELFLAALLIWLGWEKSFHAWTNQWRGIPEPPPATASAQTQGASATAQNAPRQPFVGYRPRVTASTPSGQWMWDPAHRGTLDRPAHDSKEASQDYKDAGGRNYWIDGAGLKHYNNSTPPPAP